MAKKRKKNRPQSAEDIERRQLAELYFDRSDWLEFPSYFLNNLSPHEAIYLAFLTNRDDTRRESLFNPTPDEDKWFFCTEKFTERCIGLTPPTQAEILNTFLKAGMLKIKEIKSTKETGMMRWIKLNYTALGLLAYDCWKVASKELGTYRYEYDPPPGVRRPHE